MYGGRFGIFCMFLIVGFRYLKFVLVFQLVFASVDWFFVALAQIHKWKHAPNKCKTKREKKRQIKYCCRRRALHKNTHSIAKSTDFSWTKFFFLLNKKKSIDILVFHLHAWRLVLNSWFKKTNTSTRTAHLQTNTLDFFAMNPV